MELKLKKETFTSYEATAEAPISFETTQEAIVPDYCADVARIIDTSGTVLVHNKDLGADGRVEVNGVIKTTVLFAPESGKEIGTIHLSIPYHSTCDSRDAAASGIYTVSAALRSIDSRLLNPRKLLIRADVALRVTAYQRKLTQLCTAAESDDMGLQVLEDTAETTVIAEVAEREFSYGEEMCLSASRKGIREILNSRTAIFPSESRVVGGKLVLKGIIQAEILYQDHAGELGTLSQEYLFSQILETAVSEETGFARPSFQLSGYEYTLGSENDREDDHTVSLSLHIRAYIEILEKRTLRFLADLYSISCSLAIEPQNLPLLEELHSYSRKQNMREILETAVAVRQVVDASVRCGVSTAQRGESGAWLQTPVFLKVLYLDENDALLVAEKEIQVKGETDISDGSEPTIQVCCPGEVTATPAPEGIEVRFSLEFSIDSGIRSQRACVAQASAEEQREDEERHPSIVLRKVAPGTRLWDIAKQYRTTGGDILAANQLESEGEISGDRLLLIPRKRA